MLPVHETEVIPVKSFTDTTSRLASAARSTSHTDDRFECDPHPLFAALCVRPYPSRAETPGTDTAKSVTLGSSLQPARHIPEAIG